MSTVVEPFAVDLQRQHEVAAALRAFMPAAAVLFEREDVQPYECDGLSAYRQVPMVVALPENEAQVQPHPRNLSRGCACRSSRAAPAPAFRAARCRSATACCCRSRSSCASSRSIPLARTARVQPGVRNLAISEAAAPLRPLLRARSVEPDRVHDRRQRRREFGRRALPQVRAHGAQHPQDARRSRSRARSWRSAATGSTAPGYDLLALMTGSEGMLAVVTEVTVKLLPKPECAQVVMAAFDDVEKAGRRGREHHRAPASSRRGSR